MGEYIYIYFNLRTGRYFLQTKQNKPGRGLFLVTQESRMLEAPSQNTLPQLPRQEKRVRWMGDCILQHAASLSDCGQSPGMAWIRNEQEINFFIFWNASTVPSGTRGQLVVKCSILHLSKCSLSCSRTETCSPLRKLLLPSPKFSD